jgi:hypothetical protein
MFRSPTISDLLTWHSENRSDREGGDNMVRHPCDSKAWRHFHENVDPDFGLEPRNIHFALAADGVNPFKQTRSTWSTWPVTLLNYNLPPWLCTKNFFVLLALLIPGKESVTSEVFNVYLEPLVEELIQLWQGVPAYDIRKSMDYGGSPYGQSSCGQSTISPVTQRWAVSLTKDMQRVLGVDLIWMRSIPSNWGNRHTVGHGDGYQKTTGTDQLQ